ncbi:MAG TPA: hypothetical protein ENJ20_04660 [Bacteroidetes bacterium]|nr:hypothetical protein [Bacteroidota bacterium]
MMQSFLGTGWSFPPTFDKATDRLVPVSDEEDIRQSLEILLSTRPGERVMLPRFGCALDEMLFEPLTTTLKTYMRELIRTAILRFEPRVEPLAVELDDSGELEGRVLIKVEYRIRSTNTRTNMVFPYFRNTGGEGF